jgi:fibro-slime domain-containing protein
MNDRTLCTWIIAAAALAVGCSSSPPADQAPPGAPTGPVPGSGGGPGNGSGGSPTVVLTDAGSTPLDNVIIPTEVDENGCTTLVGRIRDFQNTFPDMEPGDLGKCVNCDDRGMVAQTLGEDFKPVYVGPPEGTVTTTGPENFNMWYRDVAGINIPIDLALAFCDPDGDETFTYDNQQFFPIDNAGWGNQPPNDAHNYHFTYELHTVFTYAGGEVFTFRGDDDVFTYINNILVVDLGGIHSAEEAVVQVDALGLTLGEEYVLSFFFAERHVTASHFRIDTTIDFRGTFLPE